MSIMLVEVRMPTILVIDDDIHVRVAIEAVLKRKNFGVVVAADGPDGLQLFKSGGFDAVVLDIFMPEMDGFATIKQLRGINPSVPIIAMSGRAFTDPKNESPDFLGMAVKLGANQALQKPFQGEQLFQALMRCLAGASVPFHNNPASMALATPQRMQRGAL
jgi:CheY-like chemotaxis protein